MFVIIVPTYNERNNVPLLVERLFSLPLPNAHLLIVDDNSPDGTAEVAERLATTYPITILRRQKKEGLGRAYRDAFRYALNTFPEATHIIQMDADLSHDPADIPRLLKAGHEAHLVLGSRYIFGGGIANWHWLRRLISRLGNEYARFVLKVPYRDLTSGFKCWRREALARLDLGAVSSIGYSFMLETTYQAHQKKMRIDEMPIVFTERREGISKLNFAIFLESFWRVFALRFASAWRICDDKCLRKWFLAVAVLLGLLQTIVARHTMNPDGISYLDMVGAYLRGNWEAALSTLWEPLYAWLLVGAFAIAKPSPYQEFALVHLVNFFIYLFALASFDFFLRALIHAQRMRTAKEGQEAQAVLPTWAWIALGHTLFLVASLNLITIAVVKPDMLAAGLIFLSAGIVLRVAQNPYSWKLFVALGAVLGFGYLAKAPLFMFAFIFLIGGFFAVKNVRQAFWRVGFSLAIFLLIAGSWISILSFMKGRFVLSDAGPLAYAWYVNNATRFVHWQGEPAGYGIPLHPTRKIHDHPVMYEFGSPIAGTYPPWFDPAYWYEGIRPHFDFKGHLRALAQSSRVLYETMGMYQLWSVLVGFFVLAVAGVGSWRERWKNLTSEWIIVSFGVLGIGAYALIQIQPRFIAPFLVILLLGLFAGVRLPKEEGIRMIRSVVMVVVVFLLVPLILGSALKAIRGSANDHVNTARFLGEIGLKPGDTVGAIGGSFDGYAAFWARIARVTIVAEIPSGDHLLFWSASKELRQEVMDTFARTGVRMVIADLVPSAITRKDSLSEGWQQIDGTDRLVFVFSLLK